MPEISIAALEALAAEIVAIRALAAGAAAEPTV